MNSTDATTTQRYPILRVYHQPEAEMTIADTITLGEVSTDPAEQDLIALELIGRGRYQLATDDDPGEPFILLLSDRPEDIDSQLTGQSCRGCGYVTARCICVRLEAAHPLAAAKGMSDVPSMR